MSTKRERPNSFAGLLNLGKAALPSTEAPVVSNDDAERAMGVTAVPTEVHTGVAEARTADNAAISQAGQMVVPPVIPTEVTSEDHTAVLAPILLNRKKKERLLSWTVRLPESLKSHLERASKQYDIDMSAIVVAGTRDYLNRYFPEPTDKAQ